MKIFFHFGQNKAGSSFIQKSLNENRNLLRKHGYEYPRHPINYDGISSGHQFYLENIPSLISLAKKVEKSGRNLILSSEYFFVKKEKFKNLVNSLPGEKYFVGFFRHPLEHFNSNYSQGIKINYEYMPYSAHFESFNYTINLSFLLSMLEYKKHHQVSIESYDKHLNENQNILYTFLRNIHLPHDLINSNEKINSSYSVGCSSVKKMINRICHHLSESHKKKYANFISKLASALQNLSDESHNPVFKYESMLSENQKTNLDMQINNFNQDMKNHHIDNLNVKHIDTHKTDFSLDALQNQIQNTIDGLKNKNFSLFVKLFQFVDENYPLLLNLSLLEKKVFIRDKNLLDLFQEEVIILSLLGINCREMHKIIDKINLFNPKRNKSLEELNKQGFFNEFHEYMLK